MNWTRGVWLGAVLAIGCGGGGDERGSFGPMAGPMGGSGPGSAPPATGGTSSGTGGGNPIGLGGAPSNGGAPSDCGGYALEAQPVTEPGNVVVLFDQSWTMGEPWSDPATGTSGAKHFVAGDALIQAIAPLQNQLSAGAIFFPTVPAPGFLDLCPADVAPLNAPPQIPIVTGATFVQRWGQHFAPPWSTVLGTPLNKALREADIALQNPPPGKTVVVIFTDGHWTCMDNTEVPTVAALRARGIDTYVVGLPGAYGIVQLDQLAQAGGTAAPGCTANCFLLPSDPTQLQAQLSNIVTTTLSIDDCTFAFDPPPPALDDVHLVVKPTGAPASQEVFPDGGANWALSPDGTSATLQGATCDQAKNGGFETLEWVFGCPDSFIR